MSHESTGPDAQGNGRSFKIVTTPFNPAGGSQRLPAMVQVSPHGRLRTTTELTDEIMKNLAKFPGVTRENMKAMFGTDEETGDIAIYLAASGPNLHKVRDWGTSLGMHLGSVFRESPGLRPNTTVECDVTLVTDADNKPCFTFNIFQGKAKKREPVPGGRPAPEPKIRRTKTKKKKEDPPATGETAAAGSK